MFPLQFHFRPNVLPTFSNYKTEPPTFTEPPSTSETVPSFYRRNLVYLQNDRRVVYPTLEDHKSSEKVPDYLTRVENKWISSIYQQ